LGILITACYC